MAFNNYMSVSRRQHETELSHFLTLRTGDSEKTADLLQELFLRARTHSDSFCEMENLRAWLYRAARSLLISECRTIRELVELEGDAPSTDASPDAISTLDICPPETLQVLPEDKRWLIEEFDLNRRPQQSLADELGIMLMAFKSRLLRTRKHLRETMTELCQIKADDTSPVYCRKKMN